MSILIATPRRSTTKPVFIKRHEELVASFTYPDIDSVVDTIDGYPGVNKYDANADARNRFIARHLKEEHSHVLWIDADIVEAPVDLIQRLMQMRCIAAPFVLIEGSDQFYDVGGFIQKGKWFAAWPPYCDGEGIIELDSVGSCYLVPANAYRLGAHYMAYDGQVEHRFFCEYCKAYLGYSVRANSNLIVRHADLPRYGEQWH